MVWFGAYAERSQRCDKIERFNNGLCGLRLWVLLAADRGSTGVIGSCGQGLCVTANSALSVFERALIDVERGVDHRSFSMRAGLAFIFLA